jgi:hypothetical protein
MTQRWIGIVALVIAAAYWLWPFAWHLVTGRWFGQ